MSGRQATTSERRMSVEVEAADPGIDTKDRADDSNSDCKLETTGDFNSAAEGDDKRDTLQLIHKVSTYLCSLEVNGEELAAGFQRIPNRRVLPDYFEIISEPVAFSTIRGKIQKKLYVGFADFVKDVAQICHNAQVYNRPSAPIFGAAVRLREIFREKLKNIVDEGEISADDAILPDLGELPPTEEASTPGSEDVTVENENEEKDNNDESKNDSFDNDGDSNIRAHQKYRNLKQQIFSALKECEERDDSQRKREGPPLVMTPMEARIVSFLTGLRKLKDDSGNLIISPFEKPADKTQLIAIKNPISLDHIRKKAKRKKYTNVDQVLADIELMCQNVKFCNQENGMVYKAAVELQRQVRLLAEQEKARPDDDFRDESGKLPLTEVHQNGLTWRVGDWVHIHNPNDLAKPVIAQIFRIWQDATDLKWINACWYYRPEQTVHHYEKHFFESEVVKTEQYRDHQVVDILDRCFVMFVTQFNKGRPRGLPTDKEVYVCESVYDEEKVRFHKIKNWSRCVPEEVREKDYEMDLFNEPKRMGKVPSPIKHLLRDDAKETDEFPRPTWGSSIAPPIVGAVHRRQPDANESPQAQPMRSPPPGPAPTTTDAHSVFLAAREGSSEKFVRGPFHGSGSTIYPSHYTNTQTAQNLRSATPATEASAMHQTPVPLPPASHHVTPVPPHIPIRPLHYQYQHHQPPPSYASSYPAATPVHPQPIGNSNPLKSGYGGQAHLQPTTRAAFAPAAGSVPAASMYNSSRSPEVYTLTDNSNVVLPQQIRPCFQHDNSGRILFFSVPPLDRSHKRLAPGSAGLGHSVRYLAGRHVWIAERDKKRQCRDKSSKNERCVLPKRMTSSASLSTESADAVTSQAANAMTEWFRQLDRETKAWQRYTGLERWKS